MTRWIESGDPRSPVYIVGEAPGQHEVEQGAPFVGPSGNELNKMLQEAGWPLAPGQFFKTNICHERPPSYQHRNKWIHNDIEQFFAGAQAAKREGLLPLADRYPRRPIREGLARLSSLAKQHSPRLIITLGGSALWAVADKDSITKWRGSVLQAGEDFGGGKVVCTLHPSIIVDPGKGQYTYRPIIVQDLRRARREFELGPELRTPQWQFTIAPTPSQVRDWLLPFVEKGQPLVCDTEGWGVVDCIGFASSSTETLCIPFTRGDGSSFYAPEEELQVFAVVHSALTQCPQTFHNATWDLQVIGKNWGFLPRLGDDTMVAQHVAFPGLLGGKIDPVTGRTSKQGSSLSLSFCASMYCDEYRFWKDDGRLRNPDATDEDEWKYNCEDCARTWEVRENLVERILPAADLVQQYRFLMSLFGPVIKMMFRGFAVDLEKARSLRKQIAEMRKQQQQWLDQVLGYSLNVHSTDARGQCQSLFYEDLHCQPVKSRKTGANSTDDEALDTIARRHPDLLPLCRTVQNIRSLDTNEATFLRPILGGWKGKEYIRPCGPRLRTCLNIPGAETFRFTSNETAFGEGLNMQNFTRPGDE